MKKAIILLNLESNPINQHYKTSKSFINYLKLFIIDSSEIFLFDFNNTNNLSSFKDLLNNLKKDNYKIVNIITISIFKKMYFQKF